MAIAQSLPPTHQLVEQLPGNTQSIAPVLVSIPSGLLSQQGFQSKVTVEVPDGWQRCYNPAEGRPYFWNPDLRLFTESNITKQHVLDRVTQWNQVIASFANQSNRSDYDTVLKVSETVGEGVGICSYYLVDYNSEIVFWLRDVSTTSLGLADVRSPTHLKLLLSEQFWVHCEYMPPPHKDFSQSAKELLATLGTMCIDASSSTGSVSPFHQDECESYSRALTQVLGTGHLTEINWCLARLRSLLTQSRIINLFGEPNARTDRNVIVNGQKAPPEIIAFSIWSFIMFIMFIIPNTYLVRWSAIWVDRATYTRERRKLSKEMADEYLYGLIASSLILIASSTLLGVTSLSAGRALAAAAIMLATCGECYAILLFSTLRALGTRAADAAKFIQMNGKITTELQDLGWKHGAVRVVMVRAGDFTSTTNSTEPSAVVTRTRVVTGTRVPRARPSLTCAHRSYVIALRALRGHVYCSRD